MSADDEGGFDDDTNCDTLTNERNNVFCGGEI